MKPKIILQNILKRNEVRGSEIHDQSKQHPKNNILQLIINNALKTKTKNHLKPIQLHLQNKTKNHLKPTQVHHQTKDSGTTTQKIRYYMEGKIQTVN